MTTIFTENDNIGQFCVNFFEFAQLSKQIILSQLDINHVIDELTAKN